MALLNIRSVRTKTTEWREFILDNKIDLVALTETWLTPNDQAVVNEMCLDGYKFLGVPRVTRGGGVGLLFHQDYDVQLDTKQHQFTSFENVTFSMKGDVPVHISSCTGPHLPNEINYIWQTLVHR